jgi:hypothetical protein
MKCITNNMNYNVKFNVRCDAVNGAQFPSHFMFSLSPVVNGAKFDVAC